MGFNTVPYGKMTQISRVHFQNFETNRKNMLLFVFTLKESGKCETRDFAADQSSGTLSCAICSHFFKYGLYFRRKQKVMIHQKL